MSVRWNEQRKKWIVDVEYEYPDKRKVRVRKTPPVNTRRAAEEYERKLRAALADGSYGKADKDVPTLRAFAPDFLERRAKLHNRPFEITIKEGVLENHLYPALGEHRLDAIGVREVDAYKAAKVAAGFKPKTVNHHLSVLRSILTTAVEWGLLATVPPIRRLPMREAEIDWITEAEAERLIAKCDGQLRSMVVVALYTGVRQGELHALRWEDVDLEAGRILVRRSVVKGHESAPKSGKSREVPLPDRAKAALREQRARSRLADGLVFPGPTGKPLDSAWQWVQLSKACRRADLRVIGWHTLRHTYASWLVQKGARLKSVQELLGHATQRQTERYAHLSPDVRAEDAGLLNRPGHGNRTATVTDPAGK